jgi:hypothetical protein
MGCTKWDSMYKGPVSTWEEFSDEQVEWSAIGWRGYRSQMCRVTDRVKKDGRKFSVHLRNTVPRILTQGQPPVATCRNANPQVPVGVGLRHLCSTKPSMVNSA